MPPARKPLQKPNRPFRGSTPKGVIQTVDLGSGSYLEYLGKNVDRHPNRLYVGVDPRIVFARVSGKPKHPLSELMLNASIISKADKASKLNWSRLRNGPNRRVFFQGLSQTFIGYLIKNKLKVRHFNLDMPGPQSFPLFAEDFFSNLHRVIIPGGKIFIRTECHVDYLRQLAKKYHLSFSTVELPRLNESAKEYRGLYRTDHLRYILTHPDNYVVSKVVLTFSPKSYRLRLKEEKGKK